MEQPYGLTIELLNDEDIIDIGDAWMLWEAGDRCRAVVATIGVALNMGYFRLRPARA